MRSEIKLLHKRLGITTVYVTHDQIEAMTLGDKIAVMKDGVVQQFGTPNEIYNRPVNTFVAGFMGSPPMNLIPAMLSSAEGELSVRFSVGQTTSAQPSEMQLKLPLSAVRSDVTQYAGKSIVLQYGGFGELWGIPGQCVSRLTNEHVSCETQDSRYVPAFAIPFDEVLGRVSDGGTTYLAKWLDREIRFARKDTSVCSAAGVSLPSALALPDASDLKNPSDPASPIYIGDKPVVTEAPRVIDGDVKY